MLRQLFVCVKLDLVLEIVIGVLTIGSLGRLEFDCLKLGVLFEHLAEGLLGTVPPGFCFILLERELL